MLFLSMEVRPETRTRTIKLSWFDYLKTKTSVWKTKIPYIDCNRQKTNLLKHITT